MDQNQQPQKNQQDIPIETISKPRNWYKIILFSILGVFLLVIFGFLLYIKLYRWDDTKSWKTDYRNAPTKISEQTNTSEIVSPPQDSSAFQKQVHSICHDGKANVNQLPIKLADTPYKLESVLCDEAFSRGALLLRFNDSQKTNESGQTVYMDVYINTVDDTIANQNITPPYGEFSTIHASDNFSNKEGTIVKFGLGPTGASIADLIGYNVNLILLASHQDLKFGTEPLFVTVIDFDFIKATDSRLVNLLKPYGKDFNEAGAEEYQKYKEFDPTKYDPNLPVDTFIKNPNGLTLKEKSTITFVETLLSSISVK